MSRTLSWKSNVSVFLRRNPKIRSDLEHEMNSLKFYFNKNKCVVDIFHIVKGRIVYCRNFFEICFSPSNRPSLITKIIIFFEWQLKERKRLFKNKCREMKRRPARRNICSVVKRRGLNSATLGNLSCVTIIKNVFPLLCHTPVPVSACNPDRGRN